MEKKPEVDGSWVEVPATEIASRLEEIEKCQILVVTSARIEMCGDDKKRFEQKLAELADEHRELLEEMDEQQRSFWLLRKMLLS